MKRAVAILWIFAALVAGCATHADRLREVRDDFYRGDLELASAKLEQFAKRHPHEADAFQLDRAIVELASGRPREAEQILRRLRDRLEELQGPDVVESTATMLTDDTVSAYPGEDYERILIRAMLALANLVGNGDDAAAYALQVADLQEQIIQAGADSNGDNPKLSYKRVALGAYLFGAMREANHIDYDDAARSFVRVCSWEPSFPYGAQDLDRAQRGRHSMPGNGVLYVFALVGKGPYKQETAELPSTVSLLIADRILSATGGHTLPPTIAPVKVPIVVKPHNSTRQVQVSLGGRLVGTTAPITDVSRLAIEQYQAIYPRVLAKAVVRRVVKKGIVYGVKEATGTGNGSLLNVAMDVAGIVWEATESADTRCWGLLPDSIQVLRLELPAGEHRISLRPDDGYGSRTADTSVTIADGRNTYLLTTVADGRVVGQISTGGN